jgi:hypothetical protein
MAELALLGKFRVLADTLQLRRASPGHWTTMMSAEQLNSLFWPGEGARQPALVMRRHLDYLRAALITPVNVTERVRATAFALRFAYWRKADIARDLIESVRGPRPINV